MGGQIVCAQAILLSTNSFSKIANYTYILLLKDGLVGWEGNLCSTLTDFNQLNVRQPIGRQIFILTRLTRTIGDRISLVLAA
jgi:hypothetical protein